MKSSTLFSFIIFFSAVFLVFSPECNAQQYRVKRLTLKGAGFLEKSDLLKTLVTRAHPAWRFWEPLQTVSDKDLEDDVPRILKFYQDRGYFSVSARYEKEIIESEKCALRAGDDPDNPVEPCRVRIVFHIQKGLPATVGAIRWDIAGSSLLITGSRLEREIQLRNGKIFTSEDYASSKIAIENFLANRGHPFSDVTGKVRIDLKTRRADVLFSVRPGRARVFGEVRIEGNNGFVDPIIFDRAMTITPGVPYNGREIAESRSALFNLGVFEAAVVEAEKPADPADNNAPVPVRVRVKPKKQHSVELGVGYGTDDGIRLLGAWRYRNLTRHADRFSVSTQHSSRVETVAADYRYPYFFSRKNTFKAGAGIRTDDEIYFDLRTIYSEASIQRRFSGAWSTLVVYRFSVLDPNNVSSGATDLEIDKQSRFRVSAITGELDFNHVDNELSPTRGRFVKLSFETATSAIGSGLQYYRPGFEGGAYIPVVPGVVLAGHFFFRTIHEAGDTPDIPFFLKFFLGGSKTARGYGYQKLGVYDNNVLVDLGGLSATVANLELRYPVYGSFTGVAFVDAGVLSSRAFDVDWRNTRYSCGLGLRYHTMIGPIQLDIGYKLNPPEGSALTDASAETTRWHFHLNIGHAF